MLRLWLGLSLGSNRGFGQKYPTLTFGRNEKLTELDLEGVLLFWGICWNDWYTHFSWEDSLYFPKSAVCYIYVALILFSWRKIFATIVQSSNTKDTKSCKQLRFCQGMVLYVSILSRAATNNFLLSNNLLIIFFINKLIVWSMKCQNFTITYSPRWCL